MGFLDLILQRFQGRVNATNWQQRKAALQKKMPGRYVHKRLPKMAPANPEVRNEPYDYFYRKFSMEKTNIPSEDSFKRHDEYASVARKIPLEGRERERRPGVPGTYGIRDLPLYEERGVPSFFYREGIPRSVAKKTGMSGPRAGVPLPIRSSQRGTVNLKACKTGAPMHRGRRFASGPTNLKPISGKRGGLPSWDGKVRNLERKKTWQTATPKGGDPPKSLRQDPFDFSQ